MPAKRVIRGKRLALYRRTLSLIKMIRDDDYRVDQWNDKHPGDERYPFQDADGVYTNALNTLEERAIFLINLVG